MINHERYFWLILVKVAFASAAQLPSGFHDNLFADNITTPSHLAFSPDGRLFISQQPGSLLVETKTGVSVDPVLKVDANNQGEHGFMGVAFDPDFPTQPYLYAYYTAKLPMIHSRVSRFTVTGNKATDEKIILELDPVGPSIYHMGGTLKFGPDKKLYVGVGENGGFPHVANSQELTSFFGKILRLNSDGSIPTDNPFYNSANGNYRAIFLLGVRNPWTFDWQQTTGRLFFNDIGADTWEEINEAFPGKNYGWPNAEGNSTVDPTFVNPILAYHHGAQEPDGCAITGGVFYPTKSPMFPAEYADQYFYLDYCNNWIRVMNPKTRESKPFAQALAANPIDLRVGPDGALYYASKWLEQIYRISYEPNERHD